MALDGISTNFNDIFELILYFKRRKNHAKFGPQYD